MFKTRLAVIGLMAAASTLLVAPAATAYAPNPADISAPTDPVAPGGTFTVGFSSDVDCDWSSTFQGQSGPAGSGTTYSVQFTAPTAPGTYTGSATCSYDTDAAPALAPVSSGNSVTPAIAKSSTLEAATATQAYPFSITVAGDAATSAGSDSSDDSNGILPNTGGESLTVLALGVGLVAVGGGVAVAARRRKTA